MGFMPSVDANVNSIERSLNNCSFPTIHEDLQARAARRLAAKRAQKLVGDVVRKQGAGSLRRGAIAASAERVAPVSVGTSAGLGLAFPDLIPAKPYCADRLADGLQIRSRDFALGKRHLQLNGPGSYRWMVHDIDRPGAYFAHDDANLAPPNVIMVNKANGHAHAAYLMATPIARHALARLEPLRFFASVERGTARRLSADRCYTGLIAKNPLHPDWLVEWRRDAPYTLGELADQLFEADTRPDPRIDCTFGAGRNVAVFDQLHTVAYREVLMFKRRGADFGEWLDRCIKMALDLNLQFPQAMALSEVRAIAKSVAKWTWKHFSVEKFIARQSRLGKRGNAVRWAGHQSAERLRPWEAMGISRRTFYRRKATPLAGAII